MATSPMPRTISRAVVESARPRDEAPRRVAAELRRLLAAGSVLRVAGTARSDPSLLLSGGYAPRYEIRLFDTRFLLTNVMRNPDLWFCVAYVVQPGPGGLPTINARIFYKDGSLVWRCGSHIITDDDGIWVGKGDVETIVQDGHEVKHTIEATTDLPLEIQTALETLNRRVKKVRPDRRALGMVLRNAPPGRIEPYRDFVAPRRKAAANRANLVNRGRAVARFSRRGDPESLRFSPGFEPDFDRGVIEKSHSHSRLYGGALARFRILSTNRQIQYLFFAGPHNVWIIPPQATTTELSSYGVRTIDVTIDHDLCVPGYEYHFVEDGTLFSQIPPGFAGPASDHDPDRADASPWLDRMPVIRDFRRIVLGQR